MSAAPSIILPPPVRAPGRPKSKAGRHPIGLTRNVARVLELMVFGGNDGIPMTRAQAAQAVGIRDDTVRLAFRNPVVMQRYNELVEVLRTSARPRAFSRIVELSESAAAEGVKLKAAQYVDSGGRTGDGVTVNVGVNVQQPGYVLAVNPQHLEDEPQPSRLKTYEGKALPDKDDVTR